MVEETLTHQKEKLQDIILQHLKRILELSTQEFRGGYDKETVVDNRLLVEYVPDSRKQYIQAIESFSDVLLPFFDGEMEKAYKNIMKEINFLSKKMEKKEKSLSNVDVRSYTKCKLDLCRKLFREINYFLDREGFFEDGR